MKLNIGSIIAALAITGFAVAIAWADNQGIPFTKQKGGSTNSGPGVYYGYAKMTNSTGGLWIIPTNSVSGGTFTDLSNFGSNYVSVACVTQKSNLTNWCGTNSVTFPANSNDAYMFVIYVKNVPPPPATSQPINMQVNWIP